MLDELKKRVEQELGEEVKTVKDCQALSESIADRCGARLSDSTIRRIWGKLPSPRKPSISTLDLLSQFAGFDSWSDFHQKVDVADGVAEMSVDTNSLWHSGKAYADKLSCNTASLIFKKSGIVSKTVVFRQCVDDQISALLDSSYMATGIIAPGGYGKSLGVASWVDRNIQKKSFKSHIVYFLTGAQVDGAYTHAIPIDRWLSSTLFKTTSNVFEDPSFWANRSFVLIVDALDEIDSTQSKAVTFVSKIVEFISKYSSICKQIKVVITTRTSVWGRCLVQEITSNSSAADLWMGLSSGTFESDTTNLPLLNHNELQEALDNFINKKSRDRRLLVEQLSFMLRETISHPYMLKLFVSIYSKTSLKLQNYNDVIDEFISREIAHAKYADECLDILNFMLEQQQYGRNLMPIRKNELKSCYPIHLRKGGNYFAAYEHLLAYSILSEETFANQFKNLIVQVDFSHSNLRDLLITRYIVEANGGVTHELFLKVDNEYADSDLRIRLINNLFSIAYSENNFEAIKDFFQLPQSICGEKEVLKFIIHQFRNDKPILLLLVKEYCKYSFANNFLISTYFDFDNLNTSYCKLLRFILDSASNSNEKVYCLSGLAISSAQFFDIEEFEKYSALLRDLDIDSSCCTYSILLWAMWRIYDVHIGGDASMYEALDKDLERAELLFCEKSSSSSFALFAFYLEMVPHLLLFKNEVLADRVFDRLEAHPMRKELAKDTKLTTLFDLYRIDLYSMKKKYQMLSPMHSYCLEQQINAFSSSQSYFNRVSGYVLLASSCLHQDDKQRFMYYYQTALEICSNANLKLLEVSKIKQLACILDDFKMHDQAQRFREYSRTIVGKFSNVLYDAI